MKYIIAAIFGLVIMLFVVMRRKKKNRNFTIRILPKDKQRDTKDFIYDPKQFRK